MKAFVFPGQSSQKLGMGKDLYAKCPKAREIFEQANDILAERFSDFLFEASEDVLMDTRYTQPAIFIYQVAAALGQDAVLADCTAGHSLGEYAALVVAGLNYSVAPEPRKKTLFTIEKDGKIEAFFLTKVQFFETASSRGFKNVNLDTVMEWGISKDSELTEKNINLLAIQSFDKDVDGIQVATTDDNLARKLKKYLFVGIGKANFGVKIKSVKDPGLKDINNWRVRLAGCDTLMN